MHSDLLNKAATCKNVWPRSLVDLAARGLERRILNSANSASFLNPLCALTPHSAQARWICLSIKAFFIACRGWLNPPQNTPRINTFLGIVLMMYLHFKFPGLKNSRPLPRGLFTLYYT